MSKKIFIIVLLFIAIRLHAQNFVLDKEEPGAVPIITSSQTTSIYVDENDDWLVHKAASLLQNDIELVTGKKPVVTSTTASEKNLIVIGTVGKSKMIEELANKKKLSVESLKGKWESFTLQTSGDYLVIAGSDKRGTAYGVLELSEQIGVSPWYWWADVPVKKKEEIFIKHGVYKFGPPSVKYRGIFINDEAPAFSGWAREKFGGINHFVYEKIFELLLRLKANYLWPAMWGNAFNDDDTLNAILADKYGIVMGTSHHEPMLRAQQEWKRYGKGLWNYDSNEAVLKEFWRKGIENMGTHESIVTIGMRGDGDKPMTEGTAISLLERIVADQRKIIEDVTKKPASQTPQLWALYKEVQEYYDKGMRVPDDVTLLLCDDNWGNIRKLPKLSDKPRSGGYGIYYHFDYVGGPRNYKWINTNNIARVWEQMHLAYEYGVKNIWVVNVGDLKPMEFPISFFLDYAWDVTKWNEDDLNDYYTQWSAKQFGNTYSKEIGDILRKYSQYASRRKPELLNEKTYSENFDELQNVLRQWKDLLTAAEKIDEGLASDYKDAFFQLLLHPVMAMENLHELYYDVAMNKSLAAQNNFMANVYADRARGVYSNDSIISARYNQLNHGKWNHMMDQTHIGYTYWQQPDKQKMPDVTYLTDSAQRSKIADEEPEVKSSAPENVREVSFREISGYISIEAANYSTSVDSKNIKWKIIPGIGRDGDGITTFPVTATEQTPGKNSPCLEYNIYTSDTGSVKLQAYFSPTLNFHNEIGGLRYGISIDDEQPQIISINKEDKDQKKWEQWVANNIIIKTSDHKIYKPGKHTIKYWMVSPAVVLQKIVADFGGVKPSYLGPPETRNHDY